MENTSHDRRGRQLQVGATAPVLLTLNHIEHDEFARRVDHSTRHITTTKCGAALSYDREDQSLEPECNSCVTVALSVLGFWHPPHWRRPIAEARDAARVPRRTVPRRPSAETRDAREEMWPRKPPQVQLGATEVSCRLSAEPRDAAREASTNSARAAFLTDLRKETLHLSTLTVCITITVLST